MSDVSKSDIIYQTPNLSDEAKVLAIKMYCEGLREDFPNDRNILIITDNILTIVLG